VGNGRYFCAEAITGEITRPKMPKTVRNPADIAMLLHPPVPALLEGKRLDRRPR
jgi:hypothetical protein